LEALGFELLSGVFVPSVGKRVKVIILTLINRHTKVGAGINLIFVNRGPSKNWKVHQQFNSFVSRFHDGTAIATNNSKDLSLFPPRPKVITTILPTRLCHRHDCWPSTSAYNAETPHCCRFRELKKSSVAMF
jgi:hypothetical protein